MGYAIVATRGTARILQENGIPTQIILKIAEGRPNIADLIRNREVKLVVNTPSGKGPMLDEAQIRSLAVSFNIPCITTLNAAQAVIQGVASFRKKGITVKTIQERLGIKTPRAAAKARIYV